MATVEKLQLSLGTMTFGKGAQISDASQVDKVVNRFIEGTKSNNLDTAYIYNSGETELILNEIMHNGKHELRNHKLFIATKAAPRGEMTLNRKDVRAQLETSLQRLGVSSVDLFYLHMPDIKNPIEETLKEVNELHKEGKFKELGLSNYAAWEVAYIYHFCEKNNYIKPTVYQGMYNCITRDVDRELMPCLAKLNIRFFAYNITAGGLLVHEKYTTFEEKPDNGRFALPGLNLGKMYTDRYWTAQHFEALKLIRKACDAEKITTTEAAWSWLNFHSALSAKRGDRLIVGASSLNQIEDVIKVNNSIKPLSQNVVNAIDQAWEIIKNSGLTPKYFRP